MLATCEAYRASASSLYVVEVWIDPGGKPVTDTVVEAPILDLLQWLARRERIYEEVMDAWRTSCPRLPVWDDANDRGLIMRQEVNGRCVVKVTSSGLALLEQHRPSPRGDRGDNDNK